MRSRKQSGTVCATARAPHLAISVLSGRAKCALPRFHGLRGKIVVNRSVSPQRVCADENISGDTETCSHNFQGAPIRWFRVAHPRVWCIRAVAHVWAATSVPTILTVHADGNACASNENGTLTLPHSSKVSARVPASLRREKSLSIAFKFQSFN